MKAQSQKKTFLDKKFKQISDQVVEWYIAHGRHDLPWRKQVSPYRIWISEIMLQQTQVKTVIPYFNKFIKKYPNLKQLSEASEDEILASWSGLGFYRRARNIFASKETIKQKHKNRFPAEFEKIIALPGIGKSTAGAIMSLAYLKPQPILDGNVKRVIGRLLKRDINLLKERDLWDISIKMVNKKDCFSYTQGIMDIGATVCTPVNPACDLCPLSLNCLSAFKVEAAQKQKKSIEKKTVSMNLALVQTKQSVLLTKNEAGSIWQNLWLPFDHVLMDEYMKKINLIDTQNIQHELTHRSLVLNFSIYNGLKEFKIKTNQKYEWIKKDRIEDYGMPKPITNLIKQL